MRHIREPGETKTHQLYTADDRRIPIHHFLCGVYIPQSATRIQIDFEQAKRVLKDHPAIAIQFFCRDCLDGYAENMMTDVSTSV